VIFDFNGTISDDEPILEEIYLRMFAEEGQAIDREDYYRHFAGFSDREIIERALASSGRPVDADHVQALLRRKIDLYTTKAAEQSPIALDAAAFVRAVALRVPVAIASGAPREEIELVLANADLREVFSAVVCLEDVGRGKPDPEAYLLALDQLRLAVGDREIAPGQALVFEDADPGVQAAKAAGMGCVALRNSAYTGVPVTADLVIDRLHTDLIADLF
jgi:beta-phosphoglucomutase